MHTFTGSNVPGAIPNGTYVLAQHLLSTGMVCCTEGTYVPGACLHGTSTVRTFRRHIYYFYPESPGRLVLALIIIRWTMTIIHSIRVRT